MTQWIVFIGSFGVGTCFSLLGSISIKLMPRLGIDTGRFGSLISAVMLAAAATAILVGVGIDMWGAKYFAAGGFLAAGIAIFTIACAKSFRTVFGACLLLGAGAMCLSNFSTSLMPVVFFEGQAPAAALNIGNVAFGSGLFLTPFIASFLFQRVSFEWAVSLFAIILALPGLAVLGMAEFAEAPASFGSATIELLTQPVVIVAGLTLFCYISIESSFSNWIAPYTKQLILKDDSGRSEAAVDAVSQRMMSVFAVAIMVGRILISRIAFIETHGALIVALLGAVSVVLIYAMTRRGASWTAFLVAGSGVAFSVIFPTVLAVTYVRHPQNFSVVFGVIFTLGLMGAVIVPKIIGNLARGKTVQKSLGLLLPICVAMALLSLLLYFL